MSTGYPDGQKITQWLGAPIQKATAAAIGAGQIVIGPSRLSSWASLIVALKPTGGQVTVTVAQTIDGGPAGLVLQSQVVVAAGATLFEAFVLFGTSVTVTLQGAVGGTTVDYAIIPSNTTTNAQVLTNATINVQKNEVLVAAEPTLDFVDAGANVWTVTDDATNTRVKVTPPRIITGRINADGTIAAGTGFTVNRPSAGTYDITFTVAFAALPAFVCVAGSSVVFRGSALTTSTARVETFSTAFALSDSACSFIAHAIG